MQTQPDAIGQRISTLRKYGFALLCAAVFLPFDVLFVTVAVVAVLYIYMRGARRWDLWSSADRIEWAAVASKDTD